MIEKRKIQISLPSTGDEEWEACREPLTSGWLTQGPKVAAFEQAFAKMHNVQFALATTSCTTALHLILASLDIGPGDEVIVPAFTWVATANVVLYCGATPVLADVDPLTNNIDPEDIRRKLTSKTKAVIVVHLFGLCAEMNRIRAIVPASVKIVEDAACAAGASFEGRPAGGLADAAAFSFHPRKSITTGEGGMVTTNCKEVFERANALRNHGASISEEQRHHGATPYLLPDFNLLGFNYRMTDLQGAVGLTQLSKLNRFIAERRHAAEFYVDALRDIHWLRMPKFPKNGTHAWQAFVMHVIPAIAPVTRNAIMLKLQDKGVATRPGTHAVHLLGYYSKRFALHPMDFPGALECDKNSIAIPLHNRMTSEDYEYVVQSIKELAQQ